MVRAYFAARTLPGRKGSHGAEYTRAAGAPGATVKLASPNFHSRLNRNTVTWTSASPGTFQLRVPHCAGWADPLTTTVGFGNHPSHGLWRVS